NIGNPLLPRIQSYLNNRLQFIKVHGTSSDLTYYIPSGVPQGDDLSLLLFIFFINFVKNFFPLT
ncbi:Reverse transcriptase domain-containing protein, partial [Aphis craccivora]